MNEKEVREHYENTNILVPGGAGFIGSNLAKRLVQYEAEVTVVDSFSEFCGANQFNIRDIKKKIRFIKSKIETFVSKTDINQYNLIFNCIGLSNHHIGINNPKLDYEINCHSGYKLLNALRSKKTTCKMISIGSKNQYGRVKSMVIDESHPMNPVDVQAVHKVTLENYHKIYANNYGLDLIYLRLTNVYGPGQKLKGTGIGIIGELIRSSITGENIIIYGGLDRTKDILYIDDVVDALLLFGLRKQNTFTVYNLGGQPCRLADIVSSVKKEIPDAKVKTVPFPDKVKNMDTGDAALCVQKIKSDTGWKPTHSVESGLKLTLKYYDKYKKYYL